MDIVSKIESTKTNGRDAPVADVKIDNCGSEDVKETLMVDTNKP